MNESGLLIVLSGPSGVGKGTIASTLKDEIPGLRLAISATTRSPREGEKDGVSYRFFSLEEFEKLIENGQFLEWAQVYGNYYGTNRRYVLDNLDKGRDLLLEIDVQGALIIKEKLPRSVLIFIAPPSKKELRRRLEGRAADTPQEIERRIACSIEEIISAEKYDYIVINDEVSQVVQKIRSIIVAEKQRPYYQRKLLAEFNNGG